MSEPPVLPENKMSETQFTAICGIILWLVTLGLFVWVDWRLGLAWCTAWVTINLNEWIRDARK